MLDGHAASIRVAQQDLDRPPFPFGASWTVFDETAADAKEPAPARP